MLMAYTIPSDAHLTGDAGHTSDHNSIVDVLIGMGAVCNVLNTAYAGGADPTGVSDSTAAFTACWSAVVATGGVFRIPAGTYKTSSTFGGNLNGKGVIIYADPGAVISYHGSGDCIRMYDSSAFSGSRGSDWRCGIYGHLRIDGTSSSSGSACAAVHAGDLFGMGIHCSVSNWSNNAGSKGIWFDNQFFWTEQLYGRVWVQNCSAHVVFDQSGTPASTSTGSYDRMSLEIYIDEAANQDGVVFQNGAFTQDHALAIRGNFVGSASAITAAVLRITGSSPGGVAQVTDSNISYGRLDIGVELDLPGAHAPRTIVFGSNANFVGFCYGVLDFSTAGTFAASSIGTTGSVNFMGPIEGDSTLGGPTVPNNSLTVQGTGTGDSNLNIIGGSAGAAFASLFTGNTSFAAVTAWDLSGNLLWRLGSNGATGLGFYTNNAGGTGTTVAQAMNIDYSQKISCTGLLAANGGTDTSGTAAASAPSFTSGTAKQLSTAQDVMLYIAVQTAAALAVAIGPTSTPATTVMPSQSYALGLQTIRVPKGWWVKITGTIANLAITQVTC